MEQFADQLFRGQLTDYPICIDGTDQIRFVTVTADAFSRTAFHDPRWMPGRPCAFAVNAGHLRDLAREYSLRNKPAAFIFHTALCGSTLLSRYLAELGPFHVYREPGCLTQLTLDRRTDSKDGQELLRVIVALLSRTAASGETPLIKLHDACTTICDDLLAVHPESKGIVLYSDLESFLTGGLRSVERRRWVRECAIWWAADLPDLQSVDVGTLTDAEAAAMVWMARMYRCRQALTQHAARLRSVHCDEFFNHPHSMLASICTWLHGPHPRRDIDISIQRYDGRDAKSLMPFDVGARDEARLRVRRRLESEIEFAAHWLHEIQSRIFADVAADSRLPGSLTADS